MNENRLTPLDLTDALLARLPLFPLADAVLFPGTILPLHFFEERYRALARDCVAGNRLMILGDTAKDGDATGPEGEPAVASPRKHPLVTIGVVAAERRLPDGRWDIALKGLSRAEILVEHDSTEPYRLVGVRQVYDHEATTDQLRAHDLHSAVMQLANLLPALWPQLSPLLASVTSPGSLTDVVASLFVDDHDLRRALLESIEVNARLDILTDVVGEILLDLAFRGAKGDKERTLLKN